jgi:hypothetical protein
MQRCLILPLLWGFVGSASTAIAEPIYLSKSDAVAPPRTDAGTGLCGAVIKFINQPTPVGTVEDATQLLDRAMDDPNLVGRVSRLFPSVNLSIGLGSEADFRAPMMLFAFDDTKVSNLEWTQQAANFKPLAGAELFSAVAGVSSECRECSAAGTECAAGSYCSDGLCQSCNVPDHCGTTCMTCPADRRTCQAGRCVECTSDDACSPGKRCDPALGVCLPPLPCGDSAECKAPDVCRPEGFCGTPPAPCSTQSDCRGNLSCACAGNEESCTQKVCIQPPPPCTSQADCPMNYDCDVPAQVCTTSYRYRLAGSGLVACDVQSSSRTSGSSLGLIALLGITLLSFSIGRRRAAAHRFAQEAGPIGTSILAEFGDG